MTDAVQLHFRSVPLAWTLAVLSSSLLLMLTTTSASSAGPPSSNEDMDRSQILLVAAEADLTTTDPEGNRAWFRRLRMLFKLFNRRDGNSDTWLQWLTEQEAKESSLIILDNSAP